MMIIDTKMMKKEFGEHAIAAIQKHSKIWPHAESMRKNIQSRCSSIGIPTKLFNFEVKENAAAHPANRNCFILLLHVIM